MRIAVAGGTGTVGRLAVDAARRAGHDVVVLSRAQGVDLRDGTGLRAALEGVEVVIDAANAGAVSKKAAVEQFGTMTHNLLAAERDAGVRHHVALSIVGIDRVPTGYYAGKLRQEELVTTGAVPWTILRATQFHEFAGQLLARQKGPVVVMPTMRSATVAASEVADHLVTIATHEPAGRAPDLRGPEVHMMPDLARRVVRAAGRRRVVVPLRVPGRAGSAMAHDGLLPVGPATVGTRTFDDWLSAR